MTPVGGADARTRLRVGIIFGACETAMPILGLLAGRGLAGTLGHAAHWIGAALLIATGIVSLAEAARRQQVKPEQIPQRSPGRQTGRLLVTGIALSVDNLAVGFALGAYHVSLAVAAIVIGAVSVTMSLIGLELGHQLGSRTGERGEILGGLVLIGVGIAIAAGAL